MEEPLKSVHAHVGLGFFVELSWPSALALAKSREGLLGRRRDQAQASLEAVQADMDGVRTCVRAYSCDTDVPDRLFSDRLF